MKRFTIEVASEGNTDVVNLHPYVVEQLRGVTGDGIVHLFAVGSTVALTTLEYEPGLVKHDIRDTLQRLVPDDAKYAHEATWNDDNGHSHVRASLVGPSLAIPFAKGQLMTGQYQQVVLLDFDTRPRRRTVIGTILP